jgi:hypothetical protein
MKQWLIMLVFVLSSSAALAADDDPSARMGADAAVLVGAGHRLSGSPAGRAAGDHILAQLNAAGYRDVQVQAFPVVQIHHEPGDSVLEFGSHKLLLTPLRPNGLALLALPAEGLRGPLLYLGSGKASDIARAAASGIELQDAIVLLDGDSGMAWRQAFELGAAAVVLLTPLGDGPRTVPWVNAHAHLPRFLLDRDAAKASGLLDRVESGPATLRSRMTWIDGEGRNIVLLVPGRQDGGDVPAVVVEYDTFGPAPWQSPSPRKAMNVAGALELARQWRRNPPATPRLIVFLDNAGQDQSGMLHLQYARQRTGDDSERGSIQQTLADLAFERRHVQATLEGVDDLRSLLDTQHGGGRVSWRNWAPTLLRVPLGMTILGASIWLLAVLWSRGGDQPGKRSVRWPVAILLAASAGFLAALTWNPQVSDDAGDQSVAREQFLNQLRRMHEQQVEQLTDWRSQRRALEESAQRFRRAAQESADETADDGLHRRMDREAMQAQARRDQGAAVLDAQVAAGVQRLAQVTTARLAALRGQWSDEAKPVLDEAQLQIKEWCRTRLDEIHLETQRLNSSLQMGQWLAGRRVQAAVYLDLAPRDQPWAIGMGALAPGARWVTHAALARWLSRSSDQGAFARQCPDLAGVIAGSSDQAMQRWSVAAHAWFVLHLWSPGEAWPHESLPHEPAGDAQAMWRRMRQVDAWLALVSEQPEFSQNRPPARTPRYTFNVPQWDSGNRRRFGNQTRSYAGGALEADVIAGHAVVAAMPRQPSGANQIAADRWGARLVRSDATGAFGLFTDMTSLGMVAATHDPQGRIRWISQLRPGLPQGSASEWNRIGSFHPALNNRLSLFEADALILTGVRDRAMLEQSLFNGVRLLRGLGETPFSRLNVSGDAGVAAAYVDRLREFKLLNDSQLLLNNWPASPSGMGYGHRRSMDLSAPAAGDLWTLNESRLLKLREHGLIQDVLERLHDRAGAWLRLARDAAPRDPLLAQARYEAAQGYAGLVHAPVRQVASDMVHAVVILLLLAVPFAWALERAVVGTPNIYKQVGGFGVIFLAVFFTLYLVHPAFAFTSFPIVVLLAFVIITMSGTVIAIMWSRFEYEVRRLQGLSAASHSSTRNVQSTMLAAFAQGIASMRRRPLRTTLTAVTVVLLTFTTMFFGSVSSGGGFQEVYFGPCDLAPRVEVQLPGGRTLPASMVPKLAGLVESEVAVVARWSSTPALSTPTGATMPPLLDGQGRLHAVEAWISLDERDVGEQPQLQAACDGDLEGLLREGGVLLPRTMGISAGPDATVAYLGRRWRVRGTFDPDRVATLTSPTGLRLAPPDVAQMRRQLELQSPNDSEGVDRALKQAPTAAFPVVDPRQLVMLSDPNGPPPGAALLSAALVGSDGPAVRRLAEDLAVILREPVTMVQGGQVQRVLFTTQVNVTGLATLLPPLLLGGLIIFGTMLSSVTDREGEIYTLSALGLAPVHVSVLFLAEALVYSLLGGVGGYLLGQTFARVAQWLASMGLVSAPPVNASSTQAMFAILLVMLTVLASAIYPAFKASRSANPGIQRRWRLPAPDGDDLAIEFPFTVSRQDAIGLMSFLEEHLVAHRDRSVGAFAAADVSIDHHDARFILAARVWLQPFDQGVSQTFTLRTEPSDIEGIDRVILAMHRLSGPPHVWQRGNAVFVNELRKQFIFWRTIDPDAVEHYHQLSARRFALADEVTR